METAIERLVVLSYFIICLSHILQPRAWVQFFVNLREKGEAGIFVVATLVALLGHTTNKFVTTKSGLLLVKRLCTSRVDSTFAP